MATHDVAADEIGVHDITLTPNTVDSINFERDPVAVSVMSDGATALYITVDGSDPTVGGAHTIKLPAGVTSWRVIPHAGNPRPVKLISAGATTYDVEREDTE